MIIVNILISHIIDVNLFALMYCIIQFSMSVLIVLQMMTQNSHIFLSAIQILLDV